MKKKIKRNIIIASIGITLLATPLISLIELNNTNDTKITTKEENSTFATNNHIKSQKGLQQLVLDDMITPSGLNDHIVPENKIYESTPLGVKISFPKEIKEEDIKNFVVTNSDSELGSTKIEIVLKSGATKTFNISGFKNKKSHNDLLKNISTLKEVVLEANKAKTPPDIGVYDNLFNANINIINWPEQIEINQVKELFILNSNKENGTATLKISLYDGQKETFEINGFLSSNDLVKEKQIQLNNSQFYGNIEVKSLLDTYGLIYINSINIFPKQINIIWSGSLSTKDIISYSITKSNPIKGTIDILINLKFGISRSLTIGGFQKQEDTKRIEQNLLDFMFIPEGTKNVPVLENGQYPTKPFGLNIRLPQGIENSIQYYEVKNSNYNNGNLNLVIKLKSGATKTFLVQGFQNIDEIKLLKDHQQKLLDQIKVIGDNTYTIPKDAIYTNIPSGINVNWVKGISWLDIKEVEISNSNEITSTISLDIKLKSGANKKIDNISGFITTRDYQQKLLERININGKGIVLANKTLTTLDEDNLLPTKSLAIAWLGNLSKDDILSYSITNSNAELGTLKLTIILKSQASKEFIVKGFSTTLELEKKVLSKAKFNIKSLSTLLLPNTKGLINIDNINSFPDGITISWPDSTLSNDNIASYQIRRSGDVIKDRINLTIYLKSGASRSVDIFGFLTLDKAIETIFNDPIFKTSLFTVDNNILAPFIDKTPTNWYVIPSGIKIDWTKINTQLPNYNIDNKAILSYQVIKSNIKLGTATILLNILGSTISVDLDGFLNYDNYRQIQQEIIDDNGISFSIQSGLNIKATKGFIELNSINTFPKAIELHVDQNLGPTINKTSIISYSIEKTDIENTFTLVINLRSKASGIFTIVTSPTPTEPILEKIIPTITI